GGADDDGLLAPGTLRQLAAQDGRDVGLDTHGPSIAVIRRPVRAKLERPDVAEGASVFATRVRIQRPGEAHVLDWVERRLALNLLVLDVDPARLDRSHQDMIEQTFGA